MASNSKKTEMKRKKKTRKGGAKRKKALERLGTTRTNAELFGTPG